MSIPRVVSRSLVFAAALGVITALAWERPASSTGRFRKLAELTNTEINESSGLAISNRAPGIFWTHNDSGDRPRIFAFDQTGKHLGMCRLRGAGFIDWEDMASFQRAGKSWLLLADIGDNAFDRQSYSLYLCEEPPVAALEVDATAIRFRYEDGGHNCEAVAVDPQQGVILLAIKVFSSSCTIYELNLPEKATSEVLVARQLATVTIPLATAMDISPDGRRAVIVTYSDAFEFGRSEGESWQQAFAKPPKQLSMPIRRQGESICYGADSRTLYLTSEKSPTPLWEVSPAMEEQAPPAKQ